MSLSDARRHQQMQRALAAAAARDMAARWGEQIDVNDIRGSLPRWLSGAVRSLSRWQLRAASAVNPYLGQTLGVGPEIRPEGFAGTASDGRSLRGLLTRPAVRALWSLSRGLPLQRAMAGANALLRLIVLTQVEDAGRTAALVGVEGRGVLFTRVVQLPACARCIILSGNTYSASEGFARHPHCDCAVMPLREGEYNAVPSGRELFDRMSPAEQNRRFGEAGADAIREGASLSAVVNARRGMAKAGSPAAGTTTAGTGSRRRRRPPRLMPERIFEIADGDRDRALELLRANGYF